MTKTIRSIFISSVFLLAATLVQAQVGIGTNTPHSSAQLEVRSNNKGVLLPSVSLTGTNDVSTISSPATGLLVYNSNTVSGANTVTPGFYYFNGATWVRLIVPADNAANVTGTIAVANGGTGATSAAGAIANLGVIANSEKGVNNGVATLGSDGKIPSAQIPAVSFQSANVVASEAAMLALSSAVVGSIAIRTDQNKNYVLRATPASTLANWIELATPTSVTAVNGNSGPSVNLTPSNLGATTIGNSLFTLSNPDAITFPQFNANNTVTALSASAFRTAIGAGTSSTSGTVTSVGLSLPSILSVSGSPVTSSGTLSASLANQNANLVFAGPASGSAAAPTFRTLVAADIPTLNQNTTGTASNVTGTVAVANGGTGSTTAAGARTNLGATTIGGNLFTLTNPSSVSFPRFNADNSITALSASDFRTAIGAASSSMPTFTSGSDQFPNSLSISPTTHATSKRAAIWIDGWSFLQDLNGTGTKDFSIGQTVSGTYPSRLYINTSGNIGIGNVTPNARLDIRTSPSSTSNPGEGYLGIGTTSTAANTAGAGALRYDNTGGELEYSNGTAWKPVAVTDAAQTFTGKQTFSDIQLTTGGASGKILTSDAGGNASWQTGAVVVYSEVHSDISNGANYSTSASFNEFNTTTADNVKNLYGVSYGFIQGTGSGATGDRWVAPFTGKFRITTNAYFNYDASYANPRLYAYKANSTGGSVTVCNITSVNSTGQDIATSTSAIISMNKDDIIFWRVEGSGARIYRGLYHTFFRIESVE